MMPDGNTAALRAYEREQERREKFAVSHEAALDDLVDRMMAGEEYPRNARRRLRPQINLLDILTEVDQAELAEAVCRDLREGPTLSLDIEKLVRAHLEGSKWVDMRADEMAEEAEEDARDRLTGEQE
jgi:hypothetical protein